MFNAGKYMVTIAELENFYKDAERIFSKTEYEELISFIAQFPVPVRSFPALEGSKSYAGVHGTKASVAAPA
jgi:hypothetical protein